MLAIERYTTNMEAEWTINVHEDGELVETIEKTNRLMTSYVSASRYGRFPEILAQCLVGTSSYVSKTSKDSNGIVANTYTIDNFAYGDSRISYDAGTLTDLKGTHVHKDLAYKGIGTSYSIAKFKGFIGTTENTITPIAEMGLFTRTDRTTATDGTNRLMVNRVVFPGVVKDANKTLTFECRIKINFG